MDSEVEWPSIGRYPLQHLWLSSKLVSDMQPYETATPLRCSMFFGHHTVRVSLCYADCAYANALCEIDSLLKFERSRIFLN